MVQPCPCAGGVLCTSKDSTTKVSGQKHPWVLPNHSWGCSPCPATGVWVPPGASRGGTVPAPRSPFVRCTPSCCQQHVAPVGTENNTIGPERADFASPGPLKCRRPKPVPSRRSETWHPFRFAAPCPSAQGSCWDFAVNRVLFPFWGGTGGTQGPWKWQLL